MEAHFFGDTILEIITRPTTPAQQQILDSMIALSQSDPAIVTRYFESLKYDLHSNMVAERNRELAKETAIVILRPIQLLGFVREALIPKSANEGQELFATSYYWDTELCAYSLTDGSYQRVWYLVRPVDGESVLDGFDASPMIDFSNWQSLRVEPNLRVGLPSVPAADGTQGHESVQEREEMYRDATMATWAAHPHEPPPGRDSYHIVSY